MNLSTLMHFLFFIRVIRVIRGEMFSPPPEPSSLFSSRTLFRSNSAYLLPSQKKMNGSSAFPTILDRNLHRPFGRLPHVHGTHRRPVAAHSSTGGRPRRRSGSGSRTVATLHRAAG